MFFLDDAGDEGDEGVENMGVDGTGILAELRWTTARFVQIQVEAYILTLSIRQMQSHARSSTIGGRNLPINTLP